MHRISTAIGSSLFLLFASMGTLNGCGMSPGEEENSEETLTPQTMQALTGNGSPSGAHYTLNIIGVPNPKSATLTDSHGGRIFVPLCGSTQIKLAEGEFQVLDGNGTDGSASFQLPNPDPENDGVTQYSVYARALGTPGGRSKTTTCATDPTTGEQWCSIYSMVLVRDSSKPTFSNVSRELLYVYADVDGDGKAERYNLFNGALQDYFWQYDNSGLKLAQLRFYAIPTTVP